ncbi:MAG: hypothetical protein IIY60_10245 [Clostridia bacterium]|nr:hypothetical protein [Clostridia bacterium]
MKKILSLILVLCMLVASVPVFAEAPESESGLLGLLSGLLEDEGESQGSSLYYLMEFIAGLKMRIAGNKTMIRAIVSFLVNKLADKFGGKLGSLAGLLGNLGGLSSEGSKSTGSTSDGLGALSGLLGSLGGMTAEGSEASSGDLGALAGLLGGLGGMTAEGSEASSGDLGALESLLGELMSADSSPENGKLSEEDQKAYDDLVTRTKEMVDKETGAGVPGKKEVDNIEEFFGNWKCTEMVIGGEASDMSEAEIGMCIGENMYYTTVSGKQDELTAGQSVEMKLENGVLKVKYGDFWSAYVLTEDGTLVEPDDGFEFRYVRTAE